ncbi:GatB/YqeY domain-containing protein [Deefgea salmonis]|uniref:GatB/YqeY domain-containing protein n=1 Tax=Deefgea salmonis TaxID=2875502 RepID=A0ABS8BL38_9NEIS|nr:GatB/YqeY domain-containing protein [Deefgea salmonis]MCB5196421.1 GatB/YqeY domain-containing protein [Deefgea salmonis]
MTLKARITADMKTAMKEKQADRLGAIRLLLAAIKQREVDERIELDDAAITAIIDKMLKQRKDSITQFEAAARQDLADKEKFEVAVLIEYMPQQLSAEEIGAIVDAAIATHGATAAAMGKIMAEIKPQLAGRADMAEVSKLVKARMA